MKILNINEKFGDPVEFNSLKEMEDSVRTCGYPIPKTGLQENIDYIDIDD